ncbi:hypothetical protein [Fervidibacillus halotolerans]|uniref:Uncharacterized protein n=1 Tax=Fervidibacillus halotolerans TaxID=2980027 RepID=A0A9E8M2B6_9BACI|nr:hypothetical protein [Fervidibacillus halotolerans]WAA13059.1 hypothetical protein OE105_02725 [Fervidibacillus halotolerans]
MNNLIYGSYGLLGFELGKWFLEMGESVFHINIGDEFENKQKLEEKQLLFGRNSNFKEIDRMEKMEPIEGKSRVIVPFIDWERFGEGEKKKIIDRLRTHLHIQWQNPTFFFILILLKRDNFEDLKRDFPFLFSESKRLQTIIVPENDRKEPLEEEKEVEIIPLTREIITVIESEKPGDHTVTHMLML